MSWFRRSAHKATPVTPEQLPPPDWAPAPERSHIWGLVGEASDDDYKAAEKFCQRNPQESPKLLPSHVLDRITKEGCRAWGLDIPQDARFGGCIANPSTSGANVVIIQSSQGTHDTSLLSDLPIMGGIYNIQGKSGVYYEVKINRMSGVVAIGTACRPYPPWRMPGWNRLSAGLHLDDLRKFFEDPDGGRDYNAGLNRIKPGDTVGCGYEFSTSTIFFTYNGMRLPPAFTGIYVPRERHDVYAAIGLDGSNDIEVNFGGDLFRWKEGNEWQWRVEGHVGRLSGSSGSADEELPTYSLTEV